MTIKSLIYSPQSEFFFLFIFNTLLDFITSQGVIKFFHNTISKIVLCQLWFFNPFFFLGWPHHPVTVKLFMWKKNNKKRPTFIRLLVQISHCIVLFSQKETWKQAKRKKKSVKKLQHLSSETNMFSAVDLQTSCYFSVFPLSNTTVSLKMNILKVEFAVTVQCKKPNHHPLSPEGTRNQEVWVVYTLYCLWLNITLTRMEKLRLC